MLNPRTVLVLGCLLAAGPASAYAENAATPVEETLIAAPAPAPEAKPETAPTPTPDAKPRIPYLISLQSTTVGQYLFRFRSRYHGPNSIRSVNEFRVSNTETLDLGVRPLRNLELYLEPEVALGSGIGKGLGVAGYPNGDFITTPSGDYYPYLSRYFARYTVPLTRVTEPVERTPIQLEGDVPVRRIVIQAGGFTPNDLFDYNTFATDPRTQFLNFALLNTAAYDYAESTRGYTRGIAVQWINPGFSLSAGSFQAPDEPGGLHLSGDLAHKRGDQIEFELKPHLARGLDRAALRAMYFRNEGPMGSYAAALRRAGNTGEAPDTTLARRPASKFGFCFGFEQALGDDGGTGVFARLGWNDGKAENYGYTECDRAFSVGMQVSGRRWGRRFDHAGLAFAQNGISSNHQAYLAAGGTGFAVGDGRLSYGPERIIELYYSHRVSRALSVSLDYQFIANPGYNRDRGPVSVAGVRLHFQY